MPSVTLTHVCGTVTIGEQKVCPESESLKFSTTPTPQVENPSDSDSTALVETYRKFEEVDLEIDKMLPKKSESFV